MWVVLCDSVDLDGLWAFEGLRRRGVAPLELVTGEALAYAPRWVHRLGKTGNVVDLSLADGRAFASGDIVGGLNRLRQVPAAHLKAFEVSDFRYSAEELHAFFLGWLQTLDGQLLNPPLPPYLSGAFRHHTEWQVLAAHTGLVTRRYRQAAKDGLVGVQSLDPATPLCMALVVAGRVIAPPELEDAREPCRQLATLTATPLLGVTFSLGEEGWAFLDASPVPPLRVLGEAALDAIAEALIDADRMPA
jgi:hypothetical protein